MVKNSWGLEGFYSMFVIKSKYIFSTTSIEFTVRYQILGVSNIEMYYLKFSGKDEKATNVWIEEIKQKADYMKKNIF